MTKAKRKKRDFGIPLLVDEREEKKPEVVALLDVPTLEKRIIAIEGGIEKVWERVDEMEKRCDEFFDVPEKDESIPEKEEEISSTRTYTVMKGDTMAKIAKKLLGNAGRLNEIAPLNYKEHPSLRGDSNFVEEGWVLKLD